MKNIILSLTQNNILRCSRCEQIILGGEYLKCPECGEIKSLYKDVFDLSCNSFQKNEHSEHDVIHKYIFVFTQPVEVTDIYYQELYQLIISICNDAVIKICDNYPLEKSKNASTEIVYFKNSCYVETIKPINIKDIVRNSGYIQSAGEYIFINEWQYVTKDVLIDKIKAYSLEKNKKFELIFYTDSENQGFEGRIKNILIDHQRTYIGNDFFFNIKEDILKELRDFYLEHNIVNDGGNIFVFKDTRHCPSPDALYLEQNDKHYMILYNSEYKKENPYHTLNENRPYWAGIYTTPHDLTCAMVNIARINPGDVIYDPFLHMGTTAIEAAKYDCIILGSDIQEPLGALDNFNFVCSDNIEGVCDQILSLIKSGFLDKCFSIIGKSVEHCDGKAFPDFKSIEELILDHEELNNYENRLLFYILRRYWLKKLHNTLKHEDSIKFVEDMVKEFRKFSAVNKLNSRYKDGWKPDENTKQYVYDSHYNTMRIGPCINKNAKLCFFRANARKFPLTDNSVNVIITDPPYGYGDDIDDLKGLYMDFLSESFRVLKDNGRLVMCVLDKVKTGKPLLEDTTTKGVIELINKLAVEKGIKFVKQDIILRAGKWYQSYWKSNFALNRAIINLEIIKGE